MKMKRLFTIASVLALAALSLMPVAVMGQTITQVCLITNAEGSINDGTFNQTTHIGMIQAAEDFGLETTVIETIATVDFEANIDTCVNEGADIILTVGFPMAEVTFESAAAYPDVFFIGVDQFVFDGPENLVGLQFREDQMGFAVGVMAALLTESNILGGVFGEEIPPVVKFRNGFIMGAQYINPEIQLIGDYTGTFVDRALGTTVAEQLIGEGADIIFGAGGETGSGGIQYAAAEGIPVIGVDVDEYFTTFGGGESPGAENIITSAIKRVDVAVYQMIEALVLDTGEFPGGGVFVSDVTNDGVDFAPPNEADVPEEVTAQVEEVFEMLRDGRLVTGVDPIMGGMLDPIPDVAAAAGDFSTLLAAAEAAGLATTLAEDGPFTVFAPTDEAFSMTLEMLDLTVEDVLADIDLLTDILLYHVVQNAVFSGTVVELDGQSVETLQGSSISISVTEDGVVLDDVATVIAVDINARNGVIHVIDTVLLP